MSRAKFPAECPVFEVLNTACAPPPVGAFVVGVEVVLKDEPGACSVDCLVAVWPDNYDTGRCNQGWWYERSRLRPLTRAAREMLALVRK